MFWERKEIQFFKKHQKNAQEILSVMKIIGKHFCSKILLNRNKIGHAKDSLECDRKEVSNHLLDLVII